MFQYDRFLKGGETCRMAQQVGKLRVDEACWVLFDGFLMFWLIRESMEQKIKKASKAVLSEFMYDDMMQI